MKSPAPLLASLVAALVVGACSAPGSGGSSVAAPSEFRPIASGDMLYVWSAGVDAMLVDPKDAGVRDALHHLGARMSELPDEIGDPEFPADAIDLAAGAFTGPMSLSVGPADGDGMGGLPVRARLTFRGATAEAARARADRLTRILSKYGVPSLGLDEATGLSILDLGGIQVQHGVARAGRPDTLVVALGDPAVPDRDLGTLDLPEGATPVAAFRMDYGSFAEILGMFGGPAAADAITSAGLQDMVIQGGLGHDAERAYLSMRTMDWVNAARASGSLPSGSIEREAIALVPRDATLAMLARMNLGSVTQALRTMTSAGEELAGEAGGDPLAFVRELTGIDLEKDLIAHLGETFGVYTSDTTGGGGFFSGVAFLRVKNEADLRAALERLEGRIEDYAADQGLPALALRHSQHDGADVTTFTVSGWPIPLEPSWAIRGGWLFASASIQGLRAALDQAARPESDLLDNERFQDGATGSLDDLVSLNYVDLPRFARDGYPVAVMIGAALSNGLSSANEPERVPAGIVPGYPAFVRGTRALVALGRLDGDDLVMTGQADRSLLVQTAGVVGAMGPLPLLVSGLAIAGANESKLEGVEDSAVFEDMTEGVEDMEGAMDEDMEGVDENLGIDTDDLVTDPPPAEPK